MKKNMEDDFSMMEAVQIEKLKEIVAQTVKEEVLIMDRLAHPTKEKLSKAQLISDKVAKFGGSWKFIILFAFILFFWILLNVLLPKSKVFDPYPFILMNLVLSTIAALQAPIIMMSQNRQEEKDRKRAENDYLINLKAELEVRSMNQKVDILIEEQIKTLFEIQTKQLALLNEMKKKLDL
jgi:uncharacterized membrane protein